MLQTGFYNSFLIDGEYDREYDAEVYSNFFNAFLKDGVRRSGEDDLRVTASGMTISIGIGYAICGGRWCHNDTVYELGSVTAPVGDMSRIDAVFLRTDANEAVRAGEFILRQGTPSTSPTAPSKEEGEGIHELCLATIKVNPNAQAVIITDTRGDQNLCGWITSPVGYDDYFTSLDVSFRNWFEGVRDELSSVTLFKEYMWRTVTEEAITSVTFSIPQYDASGTDIINVYVNGLRETEGVDYTLSGSTITFISGGNGTGTKVAGTEIVIICYKSIDGTGLGSVADEVESLHNTVADLANVNEYTYVCNGTDDNVKLSQIASEWLNGGTDYASKTIKVYGTFGCSSAYQGAGSSTSPYKWMSLGLASKANRKIHFDFSSCSQITFPVANNTYNVLIDGLEVSVSGLNIICNNVTATVSVFSESGGSEINAEECRMWLNILDGRVARSGDFKNCRISMATQRDAYIFYPFNASLLRIFGGEYYAYAKTGNTSAVVCVTGSQADAVVNTYSVSCPTSARTGYVQSYAWYTLTSNATCSFTDTITLLPISAEGMNIRGTIARSKQTMT